MLSCFKQLYKEIELDGSDIDVFHGLGNDIVL